MAHQEEVHGIDGVRVCRNAPSVSHLLFAGVSLILMKANLTNATTLRHVLDQYCASSQQMVNEDKCSIFLSTDVGVDVNGEVCAQLNIMIEAMSDKYLGVPAMVGEDRSDSFVHLLERVLKWLKVWREKFLSCLGGKEILLKVVIQSLPDFPMAVFKMTKRCVSP